MFQFRFNVPSVTGLNWIFFEKCIKYKENVCFPAFSMKFNQGQGQKVSTFASHNSEIGKFSILGVGNFLKKREGFGESR